MALVRVAGVSKHFAGVRALEGVSFELAPGEIHALVGENGAGKSTLIRIISGAVAPDAGTVEIGGRPVTEFSPPAAARLGVATVYQQPTIFPHLGVAENLALGLDTARAWQRVDWRARRTRARDLLARVGADLDVDREAGDLRLPEQQLLEIARAVGARARVLILDEPTAALTAREVERLFALLGELRAAGTGIVYISHRLEEIGAIADRVSVLRDGRAVGTFPMAEVDEGRLIRLMVGRDLTAVFPKQTVAPGEPVLELDRVGCAAAGVRDVTLTVRRGEIVGLAGLVGAGRTELARTLFGLTPADTGTVRVAGRAVTPRSPSDAVAAGLAYVPEDRRRHGVIAELPVRANLSLAVLGALSRGGLLDAREEARLAAGFVERLAIKTPSIETPVAHLSGGNQQKVAVGRWLATSPAVLILDEPTQGVDVGAKAEIHRLMGELAARGLGILMISSELPEVLGMSDRIAVMRAGTIAAVFDRAAATPERVMAVAFGQATA